MKCCFLFKILGFSFEMLGVWKICNNHIPWQQFLYVSYFFINHILKYSFINERMDIKATLTFNSFITWGSYYIETSSLICKPNQWTGIYMITASVMKELKSCIALDDHAYHQGFFEYTRWQQIPWLFQSFPDQYLWNSMIFCVLLKHIP